MMQSPNLLKWQILLKVLPLTLLFALAKGGTYFLEGDRFTSWQFDIMTSALVSTTTFVVAFILSGTLIDYRASEEMVTQIATALISIQDTSLFTAANHPEYSTHALTQALIRVSESVLGWLKDHQSFEAINQALTDLNPRLAQLEQFTSGPIISRVQGEQKNLRLMVTRIKLIRETGFLAPAHILMKLFLIGTVIDLLLTRNSDPIESLIIASFLFTLFFYLVILIRDLGNPFQYDGKSCVDVDLTPLMNVITDLQTSPFNPPSSTSG